MALVISNCVKCSEFKFNPCKRDCHKSFDISTSTDAEKPKTANVPIKQEFKAINLDESEALKLLSDKRAAFLNKLLQRDGSNINTIRYKDNPLIVFACANCCHGLVKLLIKHGVDTKLRCNEGKSALYYAIKAGCSCVIELLLKQGCDPNETVDDLPYLYHAAMSFHTKAVQCLLHYGADINIQTEKGPLLMNLNSEDRQQDILKLLLAHRANIIDCQNFQTAAECFIKSNQLILLNHLLTYEGVGYCSNIEYMNYGRSLLHLAVKIKNFNCVAYLLNLGLDVNLCDVCTGETPLHLASRIGSVQLIELLMSHGAWLYAQNYQGNTPLDFAVITGHKDAIECLEYWKEIGNTATFDTDFITTNVFRCYKMHCNDRVLNINCDNVHCQHLDILRRLEIVKKSLDNSMPLADLKIPEVEYVNKINSEIKEMKAFELKPGMNCFDLLCASKPKLTSITIKQGQESQPLAEIYFKILRKKFRNCDFFIWSRIMLGVRYASIYDKTVESLEIICKNEFPSLVIEKIVDYLDVSDMEILIETVK